MMPNRQDVWAHDCYYAGGTVVIERGKWCSACGATERSAPQLGYVAERADDEDRSPEEAYLEHFAQTLDRLWDVMHKEAS